MKVYLITGLLGVVFFSMAGLLYANYENLSILFFIFGFMSSLINLEFKQNLTNKICSSKK